MCRKGTACRPEKEGVSGVAMVDSLERSVL